jgi:hypothetical protein
LLTGKQTKASWQRKTDMLKAFRQNKRQYAILFLAIILVGIGVAGYGVYSYFDAQNGINDNLFHKTKESGEEIEIPNRPAVTSIAMKYYDSQQEYNDLVDQRGLAVRYLGIGLAVVGAGWLGADFSHSRYIKQYATDDVEPPAPEPTLEDSSV